jgi:5-carboxymethyl-2-hydroxymuconate isomerase
MFHFYADLTENSENFTVYENLIILLHYAAIKHSVFVTCSLRFESFRVQQRHCPQLAPIQMTFASCMLRNR